MANIAGAAASLSLADAQFPGDDDEGKAKTSGLQKIFLLLSFGLAAATAAFAVLAMAWNQSAIVIVAAITALGDAGYVAIQRVMLIKMESK
mmetsp:Transcript_13703/g.40080  ORF Transcript_13703/g.40080 Transcript_13703/m.40080 type:complete len:91 (+) Transcript_13703:111-383(+)